VVGMVNCLKKLIIEMAQYLEATSRHDQGF
jgi:hypothetical protein